MLTAYNLHLCLHYMVCNSFNIIIVDSLSHNSVQCWITQWQLQLSSAWWVTTQVSVGLPAVTFTTQFSVWIPSDSHYSVQCWITQSDIHYSVQCWITHSDYSVQCWITHSDYSVKCWVTHSDSHNSGECWITHSDSHYSTMVGWRNQPKERGTVWWRLMLLKSNKHCITFDWINSTLKSWRTQGTPLQTNTALVSVHTLCVVSLWAED